MKMRLFPLIAFVFMCLFLATDFGQAQTPESFETSFKTGIQLYQTKDFEKARDAFAKALEKEPHNAYALTNMALTQYQLGKKGLAIGLFRQALEIDPEMASAKAGLKFTLSQLEIKEIPHQIENYETLREQFLQPVTLPMYLLITALFLFASGWTFFNYWGKRRAAIQEESGLPGFPLISSLLFVCLLISASLLILKFYDRSLTRGTIVDDKVAVQAAPGENQVALFDLYGGFEVLVRHVDQDWIQVTYPGASTGWIKKSSLLITSGSLP